MGMGGGVQNACCSILLGPGVDEQSSRRGIHMRGMRWAGGGIGVGIA